MADENNKKTVKGSCHCGFATYEIALTPNNRNVTKCNCTWCQKPNYLSLYVAPENFKLLTPSSKSELGNYAPKGGNVARYFCKKCAVHVCRGGSYEIEGKTYSFFGVNLTTIDQPQDGLDLNEFSFKYVDGLSDNFAAGSRDKPWAGGVL